MRPLPLTVATHALFTAIGVALLVGALFVSFPGDLVMVVTGLGFAVPSLGTLIAWWKP